MDLAQEDWVAQLKSEENTVLLDVRTMEECSDGIIENSFNVDIRQEQAFVNYIESLDKNKNYYVYCRSGARSGKACEMMNAIGIKNTFNLIGGMMNWEGEVVDPN